MTTLNIDQITILKIKMILQSLLQKTSRMVPLDLLGLNTIITRTLRRYLKYN